MLETARDKAAGAIPYMVTPEHTRRARQILGPDRLLAPEVKVVIDNDPTRARDIARRHVAHYLELPNYANNLRRLGYTDDDLSGGGSDELIESLIAWGDADSIRDRVTAHLDAGADHVCIQAVTDDWAELPRDQWRELAAMLDLKGTEP
jgi:probable F420-dependent oxidoreductase